MLIGDFDLFLVLILYNLTELDLDLNDALALLLGLFSLFVVDELSFLHLNSIYESNNISFSILNSTSNFSAISIIVFIILSFS